MNTLRRLVSRYLFRYWIQAVVTYICMTLTTVSGLVVPMVIRNVIDLGLAGRDASLIDRAAVTTDMDERCELYHQIEQIGIEQDCQRVWLWHLETQRMVQPWVKNYHLPPTDVAFYYPIDIESH